LVVDIHVDLWPIRLFLATFRFVYCS